MRYVILAAGRASRMGFDKVLTPIEGRSPLERILDVVGSRRAIVVLPPDRAFDAPSRWPELSIRINDAPERGMTHSLRVGLSDVSPESDIGVLLADMPSVTGAMLTQAERLLQTGADVAYPVGPGGRPGHPVLFSRRMRATLEALPDGDTLHRARDAAARVATWPLAGDRVLDDLDTPDQWEAFASSLPTSHR